MRIVPLIWQLFSLVDTKSVLFICYYKCQIIIFNLLLNKCVSTNYYINSTIFYIIIHFSPGRLCHRTCKKSNINIYTGIGEHISYRLILLPGKYLCRNHHCPLIPCKCCIHKCKHSDNRLTRTNISLYKTTCKMLSTHIILNLFPCS